MENLRSPVLDLTTTLKSKIIFEELRVLESQKQILDDTNFYTEIPPNGFQNEHIDTEPSNGVYFIHSLNKNLYLHIKTKY